MLKKLHLKSAEGLADKLGMGRVVYFPGPSGEVGESDNRIAGNPALTGEIAVTASALDPSDWGLPRAFFLVPPVMEEQPSDHAPVC